MSVIREMLGVTLQSAQGIKLLNEPLLLQDSILLQQHGQHLSPPHAAASAEPAAAAAAATSKKEKRMQQHLLHLKNQQQQHMQQHHHHPQKGLSKEIHAAMILGAATIALPSLPALMHKPRSNKKREKPQGRWRLCAFTNSARSDDLCLVHWHKLNEQQAQQLQRQVQALRQREAALLLQRDAAAREQRGAAVGDAAAAAAAAGAGPAAAVEARAAAGAANEASALGGREKGGNAVDVQMEEEKEQQQRHQSDVLARDSSNRAKTSTSERKVEEDVNSLQHQQHGETQSKQPGEDEGYQRRQAVDVLLQNEGKDEDILPLQERLQAFLLKPEKDYPFAKFNIHMQEVVLTDDFYEKYIAQLGDGWSKEETLILWSLAHQFELRWPVIFDAFPFEHRYLEELKQRYYAVAKRVVQRRYEEKEEEELQKGAAASSITLSRLREEKLRHPIVRFNFNIVAERQRRLLLQRQQLTRAADLEAEQHLQQQIRLAEGRLKKAVKQREEQKKLQRRFDLKPEPGQPVKKR